MINGEAAIYPNKIASANAICNTQNTYLRLRSTVLNRLNVCDSFSRERLARESDSLKCTQAAVSARPSTNKMPNTPRQPVTFNTAPPSTGAATGAMPLIAPIMASALARLAPLNLSVAMEREITIPPAAAMPCTKRSTTNVWMFGAKIHASVEAKNSHMEISSGARRPYLSLSGPNRICPAARPSMENVSPSCTAEVPALK